MADFENGDVVRLGAGWLNNTTDAIVNVWTVQINSGGPLAFAAASQDFQDYLHTLYAGILPIYPTTMLSDRITVKNETQATVWGAIAWKTPLGGAGVTDPLAQQTALLGWGRTQISRVQIRKYFGPFTEAALSLGLWTAGVRALCQTMMDYHIVANAQPNGLVLQGVAYNPLLSRATTALSATTTDVPVVQRRRRRGRGA